MALVIAGVIVAVSVAGGGGNSGATEKAAGTHSDTANSAGAGQTHGTADPSTPGAVSPNSITDPQLKQRAIRLEAAGYQLSTYQGDQPAVTEYVASTGQVQVQTQHTLGSVDVTKGQYIVTMSHFATAAGARSDYNDHGISQADTVSVLDGAFSYFASSDQVTMAEADTATHNALNAALGQMMRVSQGR